MINNKLESIITRYKGFVALLPDYTGNPEYHVDLDLLDNNFPKVKIESRKFRNGNLAIKNWCQEQFGDRWIYNYNDFYFHNEQDASWFKLRWS